MAVFTWLVQMLGQCKGGGVWQSSKIRKQMKLAQEWYVMIVLTYSKQKFNVCCKGK